MLVFQRAIILLAHLFQYNAFAIRLVDRHVLLALEPADFLGRLGALVQDLDQLPIDLVDFLAPVCDIHRSSVVGEVWVGHSCPTKLARVHGSSWTRVSDPHPRLHSRTRIGHKLSAISYLPTSRPTNSATLCASFPGCCS